MPFARRSSRPEARPDHDADNCVMMVFLLSIPALVEYLLLGWLLNSRQEISVDPRAAERVQRRFEGRPKFARLVKWHTETMQRNYETATGMYL